MFILSMVIALYALSFYVRGSRAFSTELFASFSARPGGIYSHVLFGALALIVGPFQFRRGLLVGHRALHRALGRVYLVSAFATGVVGLYMAWYSFGGMVTHLGFGILGALTATSAWIAYARIRALDVRRHREWVIRSFALIFAAVTLRIELPLLIIGFKGAFPPAYAIVSWLCWVPNLLWAEWYVRRSRRGTAVQVPAHSRALAATAATAALLFATLSSGAGAQAALRAPPGHGTRGTLYIVGGGPQPEALVREFVQLAGGPGRARIVVFAMASSEGRTSGEEKAEDLRKLGAAAINVYVDSAQASTDSVVHLLDGATGIWFGGGDQSRLTRALHGTRTERAIHARYAAGAVVGGTSAGAAVMSATMITGDERRLGGSRPPSDSSVAFITIDRDNIVTDSGFALLTNAIVDQHFVRRRRHNRLVSLVLERPEHLGVGIDESSALVVEPDGRWRVAGASVVVIYDARRAMVTRAGAALGAADVRMHVLPAGSRFDPRAGVATLPGG